MSEYIPTIEEVREAFASRFWDDYSVYQPTEEDLGEERANFYRWLAEHNHKIREQALARIGMTTDIWEAKAEAWEEGARDGCMCQPPEIPNPYRQGETA